jgi:hypothetical protein
VNDFLKPIIPGNLGSTAMLFYKFLCAIATLSYILPEIENECLRVLLIGGMQYGFKKGAGYS